jgi:hypothetical protein
MTLLYVTDLRDTVINEENEEVNDVFQLLPHASTSYRTPQTQRFLESVERKQMQSPSLSVHAPTPNYMR